MGGEESGVDAGSTVLIDRGLEGAADVEEARSGVAGRKYRMIPDLLGLDFGAGEEEDKIGVGRDGVCATISGVSSLDAS